MPPPLWVASIKAPATRPPTLWPPQSQLSTKTLWCCQHLHFVLQIPLPPLPFKPFFIASEPPLARPTTQVASPCHGWLFKPRPASTVATKIVVGNSTYPDGVSTTLWLFFCQLAARLRCLAPPSHSSSLRLLNVTSGSLPCSCQHFQAMSIDGACRARLLAFASTCLHSCSSYQSSPPF